MIEFTAWISIPIKVYAKRQKAGQGYSNIGLQDIEICLDGDDTTLAKDLNDLKDSILDNRADELEDEAWGYV